MSLIAIPGGPESNSYVTVEEADEYFEKRLNASSWENASKTDKEKALMMATSIIDSLKFVGTKLSTAKKGSSLYQNLQWPRVPKIHDEYMLNIPHLMYVDSSHSDWVNDEGEYIIPKQIKQATFEEAFFILNSIKGLDKRDFLRAQGMNSISYPGVSETFIDRIPLVPAAKRLLNSINCLDESLYISRR